MNAAGLITIPSRHSVPETIDRLVHEAESRGLTVFVRVDHGANARTVGLALRPTELILFGNPQGGTPFMQAQQTSGIDLPLKALAWEDVQGKVWLTYNDPRWIARRHDLEAGTETAIATMARAMASICGAAAG
jgi:uncharacterized protein (DUF302 family)